MPVSIAIAVLRHRLYDVDRIANRTIVYAAVTIVVGAVYSVGVLIAGNLFGGSQRWSDWIVAGSTLVAFGVFRPVRARVQDAVDRHFNRPRYDAYRTLAAFNASLREQLDTEALIGELLCVTRTSVEPNHVALWLRPMPRTDDTAGPRTM